MSKIYNRVARPVTLVFVLVAFLSTIFLANLNFSYAAAAKKKVPAVTRLSAVEYTEVQIKQLQDSLNITEAQKELWNNLTQVMRENAEDMDELNKEREANSEPMNAVEHLKLHREITETHLDQLEALIPPLEALYASMSDEQKKTTDAIFRTGQHEKNKKHHKSNKK